SHMKRSYGWNRTELTGINGARTWCGHGVFAHNLVKIGSLAPYKPTSTTKPRITASRHSPSSRRQSLFQVEVASWSESRCLVTLAVRTFGLLSHLAIDQACNKPRIDLFAAVA
ncbi:MAG: transposase, family, partial [Mycobacterium sp.]|nr:transposase, family [Mycobacterium sp.]